MPVTTVKRSGARVSPREVPTDSTVSVLPLTFDRLGGETTEDELPTRIASVDQAFAHFRPTLSFRLDPTVFGVEFAIDLQFHAMTDFDPMQILTQKTSNRNDLSLLQSRIELLHRMRERFTQLPVRRAWESRSSRLEILGAVRRFEESLRRLSTNAGLDNTDSMSSLRQTDPAKLLSPGNQAADDASDTFGIQKAGRAIEELFNVIHPAPANLALVKIFSAESAAQFLDKVSAFANLLDEHQGYDEALTALDIAIEDAEQIRNKILGELFKIIRPVERSYRQLQLFFENAEVKDSVIRPPVEFFVFNADTAALENSVDGASINALNEFIQSRNDTFNFRQSICSLVVPGYVNDAIRRQLENIADQWGLLLICDLRDEMNFKQLNDQFRSDGGAYEFMKRPEDRASTTVVLSSWLKLRDGHWFEDAENPASGDSDLYGPSSLVFAGSLARTDRTVGGGMSQGPVGSRFGRLRGVDRARIEPRISQMEQLTMSQHLIAMVRDEDNKLCFVGSRTQADDPNGTLKYFTSYRVLRYIERRISVYLRRVSEQRLTRDLVKEQVRNPIEDFLNEEVKRGTIRVFELNVDMDEDKFAQGILDITLEVQPIGPAEHFSLRIDTPSFGRGDYRR